MSWQNANNLNVLVCFSYYVYLTKGVILVFRAASGKEMSMDEIASRVAGYLMEDTDAQYEITVGTDSQSGKETKMVEVIAVHRKGRGGIYFYNIEYLPLIRNLRQKINEETGRSLLVANELLSALETPLLEKDYTIDDLHVAFQIHCDIGTHGKTSMLIKEITRWVTGQGYICLIKPYSYTASGIANKYSK